MIIYKCDKCGLEEKQNYFNPKLIKNVEDEADYHNFWYFVVSGSGSYISSFPISHMYVDELESNLCNICFEKWTKYQGECQNPLKKMYKEFLEPDKA